MTTYRFNPRPIVKWPVEVSVPVDGGATERQSFTAHFELRPRSERHIDVGAAHETMSAFLAGVLVGWDDLQDADGAPLPFDAAARDALLDVDYVYLAVAQAYGRAISGIDRKN